MEAVVLRPVAITDLAKAQGWPLDGPEAAAAAGFASEFLARCEFEPWLVVNRLSAQASNLSKPWQLQRIKAWFDVPRTLVTTDPAAATSFAGSCQRIIVKSVSAVRSIVREVDGERDLGTVAHCPTLFQERIDGTDVRVHTIGRDIYAELGWSVTPTTIATTRAPIAARPLPDHVARRCTALSASLGLHLAGIDLRVTVDGRWVCFESTRRPPSHTSNHGPQPRSPTPSPPLSPPPHLVRQRR